MNNIKTRRKNKIAGINKTEFHVTRSNEIVRWKKTRTHTLTYTTQTEW